MYFVHVYLTSRTIERLPGTRYKFYTRNDVGRRYIYLLPTLPTYGVLTLIFPFSYSKLKTTRRPLPNRPTEHNAHAHTYIAHITFATLCLSCLVCRGRGRDAASNQYVRVRHHILYVYLWIDCSAIYATPLAHSYRWARVFLELGEIISLYMNSVVGGFVFQCGCSVRKGALVNNAIFT